MGDIFDPAARSRLMSKVRSRNTKPEVLLRKALWQAGYRYRLTSRLPGKPDIVYPRARLAVFVDGCFWHCCPIHGTHPQTNAKFWREKLQANVSRDLEITRKLKELQWKVIRVWEHEIEQDVERVVQKIAEGLKL